MAESSYVVRAKPHELSLWKGKSLLLKRLDMELTERCNNNCIHCCINQPADNRPCRERELSTEEIERILKEAATLSCMAVRFTGGEWKANSDP